MNYCQLVVFNLGLDEYGVNISCAQEIIRIPKVTNIPSTPSFVKGIINLRGKIIPVFDLKKRFGIDESERSIDSRLLILEIEGSRLGIIVDDVSEVLRTDEESIQHLVNEMAGISQNSIDGITIVDERIIIILNVLKLKEEIFKYNLDRELIS